MGKIIFDRHAVCHKCRGWDCLIAKRCDVCLNWSQEEMEAYVKHCKSLVSKDRKGKDALPKPPPSPGPVQSTPPLALLSVSDVANRISSQLSEMSASFDRKLEALQAFIVSNFSSMQSQDHVSMSARLSHPNSFSAPPKVPVPGPAHEPEVSRHQPDSTVGFNREFQASGVERVPSGFQTPFPVVQGECVDRIPVVESTAGQAPPVVPDESVQHAEVRALAHVHFTLPSDASPSAPEQVEEEEDDVVLVVFNPLVVDKTLVRLADFIHERYPESHPLSAPQIAQWCGFESLYAVTDPPGSSRPRFHLYPRVADIIQGTRDRASSLARRTKPLTSILPKKRRLQSVADEPEFSSPQVLNPDFSQLAENKSISNRCMSSVTFFELERRFPFHIGLCPASFLNLA